MAAYEVELTARARKQYKALDPPVRNRVRAALTERTGLGGDAKLVVEDGD